MRDLKARFASGTGQGAASLLLFSAFVGTAFPGLRPMVILAILAGLAIAFVSLREPSSHEPSSGWLPALVIAAATLSGAQLLQGQLSVLTPAFVAVAVVATLGLHSHVTRAARLALPLLIAGLAAWLLTRPEPHIDVHVFLTDGVHALLAGHSPYSIDFPTSTALGRPPTTTVRAWCGTGG